VEKRTRLADSSFKRFKGLMLESRENFNYALVFEMPFESRSASSIHMMFMNFPIDALFLDSEKRIVDIAENLQPWVLNFTPKKPAKFIIEMKAGLAKKFKLKADGKMVF
jgi:hypothetical protein